MKTKPVNLPDTILAFDRQASLYQDKFMDFDLYNDTYDLFCALIPDSQARMFEIGCGPGNITRYILLKRPGFRIEAIDLAPNMIELARKNNPEADFKVMDCRNIKSLPPGFDAVMCGFCMPYLSKEECAELIEDCSGLLNHGGIFYFSVIEGNYDQSGVETSSTGEYSAYVYYHQEDYLQRMLEKSRFETLHILRKAYPKPGGSTSAHMIFIAKKK